MKKGIPRKRRVHDVQNMVVNVDAKHYVTNAKFWKLRQMQGEDMSVTEDEVARGFFMRQGAVLFRYVG